MLIYIHGFASSSHSQKAQILSKNIQDFISLDLSHEANKAMASLEALIHQYMQTDITLIGSSLGGFYATYISEKYHLKTILVNPSTQPFKTLQIYVNQQVQNYSKEVSFFFETKHLDAYKKYQSKTITASNYLLLLQKGDQSLDYKLAEEKYQGAEFIIEDGGSHEFDNFESKIEHIKRFILSESLIKTQTEHLFL